jgi:hypothetical protein
MSYDHEAIFKAYPGIDICIEDGVGVFDKNHDPITLDQTKIDAARVELDKLKYQKDRTTDGEVIYDSWRSQLAMLYDDMIAGKLDTTGTWATHIKAVKDANPKP